MKKKTLRSRFEDNYTTVTEPADNKKGYVIRYVYYAPWYIWQMSKEAFTRKKQMLIALELFGLVLFFAGVLSRSPLNSVPIVAILTALAFCAQIMEFAGLIDFMTAERKTTQIRYEDIQHRLTFYPAVRGILMGLATFTSLGMLVFGQVHETGIWVIPCFAECAVLAWQISRSVGAMPVSIEDNDAMVKIITQEKEQKSA